ncbi:MAG: type II toxin-antitoxin system VapC family toxin [Reyranella sp.]|uniref:type II toxin-antitoxin system VapC family toxin n=1 Tax=Reyranella sp. TaxID=1929291 RepID=UPI001AC76749|nr:type II toxin-antitoxin system VapC family toxin [Reyranella sp.]MBN9086633.1 type II toxin-antitoxin system VapC family toxin [Reyranella sp.]
MTLLLDTHTILWLTEQVPKLGRAARQRCDAALAADDLAISTIVYFELGWALKRGRIEELASMRDWHRRLLSMGVREIGLSAEIALRASELDDLHGDPVDRIIVSTALIEDAVLVTADRLILNWPGQLRRQDASR